jgi:hypothetical protein
MSQFVNLSILEIVNIYAEEQSEILVENSDATISALHGWMPVGAVVVA